MQSLFYDNTFYFFPILAVVVGALFITRGFRQMPGSVITRYFIPALLLADAVLLWPGIDSAEPSKFIGAGVFTAAVLLILADVIMGLFSDASVYNAENRRENDYFIHANIIYDALQNVAAKSLGALVIIERRVSLEGFLSGGVPFDSDLDADVLASLFLKESVLHDGGVIVSMGRIKMIKGILPLSANPAISHKYGTRHRAAIGITEETDAIAFVASEERNTISVAFYGNLVKITSKGEMEAALQQARRAVRPR
ncbi:MAG: DNA integrity scanning protein DisA nucleotide-binding domain protein [Candidatus Omnitrophica bacterium]|nr:DNA integrity scanning protein DisA nucleotide-binding domain protein [Candidatus Omnitrophota bacterium]